MLLQKLSELLDPASSMLTIVLYTQSNPPIPQLAASLCRKGYHVIETATPQDITTSADKSPVDLIILDVPSFEKQPILNNIREDERLRNVFTFIFTEKDKET